MCQRENFSACVCVCMHESVLTTVPVFDDCLYALWVVKYHVLPFDLFFCSRRYGTLHCKMLRLCEMTF